MKPMLAVLGNKEILKNKDFIFEPKLDGYRALLYKDKDSIKLLSRNNINLTNRFPELLLKDNIKADSAIIDGEIVVYNKKGHPDFQLVQGRHENPSTIEYPATYVAFDILEKDGKSLLNLPLTERKKILQDTIIESKRIQINLYTDKGEVLWKEVSKLEIEGVIAKRKSSPYQQQRSQDWIKVKLTNTLDAIIIGYTKGKRAISSLALGLYEKESSKKIIYLGKVGTGFSESLLEELKNKLEKIKTNKKIAETTEKDIIWTKPLLVAEIKYHEFTKDKILRAPVFLRLRDDKKPEECLLS